MKNIFTFLSFLFYSSLFSQNCSTSLLFKKGVVLTYKTYLSTGGMFKPEYAEMTQLVYIVKEVEDSNGSRYSHITKTGINSRNKSQQYQREYILLCDGATVTIPADFYLSDTIYFSNRYPDSKDSGFYAATTVQNSLNYQFPVDVEKGQFIPSGRQITFSIHLRDYYIIREKNQPLEDNRSGHRSDRIIENIFEEKSKLEKYTVAGEATIATTAGTYTCKKISVNGSKNMPASMVSGGNLFLYYHPKVGVVKMENEVLKRNISYLELFEIKE